MVFTVPEVELKPRLPGTLQKKQRRLRELNICRQLSPLEASTQFQPLSRKLIFQLSLWASTRKILKLIELIGKKQKKAMHWRI